MTESQHESRVELLPVDNHRLANLCGALDGHLRQIELGLGVEVKNRGNEFVITGPVDIVSVAQNLLQELYESTEQNTLTPNDVHLFLQEAGIETHEQHHAVQEVSIKTRRNVIRGRSPNQKRYLQNITHNDINFGIGPAGTGKTYLAVACAVAALETDKVRRLVLVRPAVEAGEKLGFLPGDLTQKVDPYLRPLYDALYEMLGFERVAKYIERNIIEVAPLAFMRGRTLNESFIILDEAQNTTTEQMKMFLTRIGFGSTAVITGDVTQIDLPRAKDSGLKHVLKVLQEEPGISFSFFKSVDVVRHPLVARILNAYEKYENHQADGNESH